MSNKYMPNTNLQNQLVQWLNDAGMAEGTRKSNLLRKILEVILHQGASCLPTHIETILSYGNDKSNEVKKQVIVFIEEISKLHRQYIPLTIGQLRLLVIDTVIAVQKRAIQAASIVYRNTLLWICSGDAELQQMQFVWDHLSELKLLILNMIDSDNEGIRTHSIKFLEEVVLLQSPAEGGAGDDDFSLDNLSTNVPFIKRKALEEESDHIFTLLVKFHNSQHISSVNLMACMTTLCLLAKFRPKYMSRVIQALGDLHTTLPPTLSQSQVNSVRKQLKMLLINLIKHPSSSDAMPQLTQLLLDIGMTPQEINKALPKERRTKRLGEVRASEAPAKRARIDSPAHSQGSDSNSRGEFPSPASVAPASKEELAQVPAPKADVTEDMIANTLDNIDVVVELVMDTLLRRLPAAAPPGFGANYTPIPNSGTKAQKRNLAKMLLALIQHEIEIEPEVAQPQVIPPQVMPPQVTPEVPQQSQPSLSDIAAKIPLLREDDEKLTLKNAVAKLQESTKAERQMEGAVSRLMEETRQEQLKDDERRREKDKEKPIPPPTPTVPKLKQKVKLLKLQEITRPIPKEIKEKLVVGAVERILRAEADCAIGGAAAARAKLLAVFASSYSPALRDAVLAHVLAAPALRADLALSWLYEEYAFMQGFSRHPVTLQPKLHEKHDQNYNQLLCALITNISEQGDPADPARELLLRRIYAECPVVTDEAVDYLKHLVTEERSAAMALEVLEELCIMRPPRAPKYVAALVCHVLSHHEEVRSAALAASLRVYARGGPPARRALEKAARLHAGFLALAAPPPELAPLRAPYRMPWSDGLYKMCLNLIMALFPENQELIIEVARIYGCAEADAKRVVLRAVEAPVREAAARAGAGAALSPALAALLDECPRGAETLLTRIIHIFTEKAPPSPELVQRVRELYATRVSDVRFLIPVLSGLTKSEILAALPKLIKLNPVVVKEVFNKLLGIQNPNEDSPVSPAELLVALHLIEPGAADLKYIIKATALCFGEKHTYTQDVVSAVLQRLTEEHVIPVLLMRSVLQALTLYPALGPLTLNILQLLLEKEVWSNKVAWEGWLKCCERLVPTSSFLLLSLPQEALQAVMTHAALAAALRAHAGAMPPHEQVALPPHVQLALRAPEPQYAPDPAYPPQPVPPPAAAGAAPNPLEPLPPGME